MANNFKNEMMEYREDERDTGTKVESVIEQRTLRVLAEKVLELFSDPRKVPEEHVLQEKLLRPLEGIWQAKDVCRILQSNSTASNFCGKVFKNGEPAIFCKDCQTDPTCCLCLSCFENSEHKNHNYRMFASGGGGCCDCGDPEAWTSNVHCTIHEPSKDSSDDINPLENLPPALVQYTQQFLYTILWYCMEILNWKDSKALPTVLMTEKAQNLLATDTYVAFLMNDEIHTYDEVIKGLHRHVGMSNADAVAMATEKCGRGILCKGSENQCEDAKSNINKELVHHPLNVTLFHSVIASHQNCALYLLNYLKDLAEKSDGFCRLLSQALTETNREANNYTILDLFFLNDNSTWIDCRLGWHKLIMCSIFKDFQYKKHLAITLAKNYTQLSKNFIEDSHNHDVCAINLTVQLFTVTSLSRMLTEEHNVLKTVVDTLIEILSPFVNKDTNCLYLHSHNYKHERIAYIITDLKYILRNKPDVWTDRMRSQSLEAVRSFVKFLSLLSNMDSVKRQYGAHIAMEPQWENSFNFNIILQMAILLFLNWCTSDQVVLKDSVKVALLQHLDSSTKFTFKFHNVDKRLIGKNCMELVFFDIMKDKVSFHQPLIRFIAGMLPGASRYNISLTQLLDTPLSDRVLLSLMENSLRAVVLSSQVLNGMWKRNGFGVLNQAIHYQYQLCHEIMYKQDIMMLQSVAAILDPNVFVYSLVYKFRLENWLIRPESDPKDRKERGEDALKFLISELEEFAYLMIVVFGERFSPGVGEGIKMEDSLEREVIHMLYFGPQSHSQIMKRFKLSDNESKINELLKKVAVFRKISGKSVFELREEYSQRYDPFYYRYSKVEHSQAEEVWHKSAKAAAKTGQLSIAPPYAPPPFTTPYRGILNLLKCPVLMRVMYNVFQSAATDGSKIWSVRLLHECVHLCALMLVEEQRTGENFFAKSCLGLTGKMQNILPYLEILKSTHRLEERQHLLLWVIKVLNDIAKEVGLVSAAASTAETEVMEEVDCPTESNERQQKAEEHRKRVMMQMSKMQKDFYLSHKNELDLIDTESINDSRGSVAKSNNVISCAVGVAPYLNRTPCVTGAKCILCQEETSNVAMVTDKTFVMAANVQRSSVLRRTPLKATDTKIDYLNGLLDNKWGVYTGGCGHILHSACWQKYIDNKKQEHSRRYFFHIPGHSILWQDGEYLCPLCQSFGNTIVPLSIPLHFTVSSLSPVRNLSLEDIRNLIRLTITRGAEIIGANDETESSVDLPEFNSTVMSVFPGCSLPLQPVARVLINQSQSRDIESTFFQCVFMQGYCSLPDEENVNVPIAQWQNCSYTISALEHSARNEGKFLLDYIKTRHVDCVRSLIQLSWNATDRVETKMLSEYANRMSNILMPTMSAFSEQPSVVDMDVFALIVNLHFTLSSLVNRLTTDKPHLPNENPLLTPLIGCVDEYLVSIGTAVQMMQYLLCCLPGMETNQSPDEEGPAGVGGDSELLEGRALQSLWTIVRRYAGGSDSDHPPSPYSLYIGLQQHLYPFLQSTALFYHCLTGINFIHSSASGASNFSDLCKFLNLPVSLSSLFQLPVIKQLCQNLCCHPKLTELTQCSAAKNTQTPSAIANIRRLIDIPLSYSELIKIASEFKCPKTNLEADESQSVMVCLLCGDLICSNCYSCQVSLPEDDTIKIGGLTQHSQLCGGGFGIAIWIVESYVVLLDARDLHNVRGCTVTPPYIDEYGEYDPGLRRGNPLKFNSESYTELQQLWVNHQLPEKIRKEMEQNMKLMRIKWSMM